MRCGTKAVAVSHTLSQAKIRRCNTVAWTNGRITLYHGTDDIAAAAISKPGNPMNHGISLARCRPNTDFGLGFYTTTRLSQAKSWANLRYKRGSQKKNGPYPTCAVVLSFKVDRDDLAYMHSMSFVREGTAAGDFWSFVRYCRNGNKPHLFNGTSDYDVIYGLVTLWPQTLIVNDCDQVSFHTQHALGILPVPTAQNGSPTF